MIESFENICFRKQINILIFVFINFLDCPDRIQTDMPCFINSRHAAFADNIQDFICIVDQSAHK